LEGEESTGKEKKGREGELGRGEGEGLFHWFWGINTPDRRYVLCGMTVIAFISTGLYGEYESRCD